MRARRNHSQRGNALHASLIIAVLVAAISGSMLASNHAPGGHDSPDLERAWVDAIAAAALDAAVEDLRSGGTGELDLQGDVDSGWTSEVTDFPEAKRVVVEARHGGIETVAEALVEKRRLPVPAVVYMESTDSRIEGLGEHATFSGIDLDWDGQPGDAAPIPRLACAGTALPAGVEAVCTPRIGLAALAADYARLAENEIDPSSHSASWGDREFDHFAVSHCGSTLSLWQVNRGAGILVVEGDLTISGVFVWHGAVLVTGALIIEPEAVARIHGQLLVGREIRQAPRSAEDQPGTLDVEYSARSLAAIRHLVTYQILEELRPR
jgi:hypothetical protein